jgi:hypothetical protein
MRLPLPRTNGLFDLELVRKGGKAFEPKRLLFAFDGQTYVRQ